MKASSKKVLTTLSVAGLTLVFAVSCTWQLHAQTDNGSGGSFTAPQDTSITNGWDALLKARRALAGGELARARSLVETARQLPIDSSMTSDTPAKVEAMINRHTELTAMNSSGDLQSYNQGAALFLLEQADRLLEYRDFVTAQSLINLAGDFDVTWDANGLSPAFMQGRLQQLRSAASQPAGNISDAQRQADSILSQAQLAFDQDQLDLAEQLIAQVKAFDLADSAFEQGSILPWELELKIQQARQQQQDIAQAGFDNPGGTVVQQADYYPELDTTRNMQVSGEEDGEAENNRFNDVRGRRLYDSGMSALTHDDTAGALEYFRMAWQYRDQLDPATRQDLQEKLTQLQISADADSSEDANENSMNASFDEVEQTSAVDDDLRRQMFSDVLRQRAVAERMVEQRNPRGALNHMRLVRDNIQNSDLDAAGKSQLVAVVEREIAEMERFIEQNLGEIENDEMNRQRRQEVEFDRQNRDDVERKIQALVNDFNRLLDEQRFEEAEYLARQANELAPEMDVVKLMVEKSKMMANNAEYERIREQKADDFVGAMLRGDESMTIPVWEDNPLTMNPDRWEEIQQIRNSNLGQGGYASERERVIWSALKNQTIQAEFNRTPLSEAIQILAERTGVNMIFDSRALEVEDVAIDQPITMSFPQPISIESALNIILGDNGLVFKVDNEVVKITNKSALQANPIPVTYYVGDLIMPVPDFSGNPINMQFMGAQSNQGTQFNPGMNNFGAAAQGNVQPVSLNQQMPDGSLGFGGGSPIWSGAAVPHTSSPKYNRWGPMDVGGGITEQDFEELMDLIQETIDPDSWEENGGTGRMRPFPATLSLIITQTQENQDRIQNLLTRLRELNDVQIVVEVRFIRLRDDFFERIGVDFDFQFNDNSGLTATTLPDNTSDGFGGTAIVGRQPVSDAFIPTGDLDIPVTQNSFGSAIPQFGGFDAGTALNFGFAILSDIEVFFLLQAAKGDERSNVTNAPTVTMFNGQSATVFDGSQRPFVTSVTPVVGDFAAAQQPIITILPEGTQLNVRAVASADRRFVRMTLVPFFSQVTDVQEFTFDGQRSVRRGSGTDLEDILDAITGNPSDPLGDDELEITESGTTVQLPVFANTTITTTVSVPDGGTVLLGGIKQMSETRIERGVPFLSSIPYVNRLFKNVGIGRETNSLMMMVTPRIIIQEEEEARQVGGN